MQHTALAALGRSLPLAALIVAAAPAAAQIDQFEESDIPQPSPNNTETFGRAISFDGTSLAAGSPSYDVNFSDDGAAYVWEWGPGGIGAMTTLTSPSGSSLAHFGSDVAVDGNTLVVGEERSDLGANEAGAVHVYVRAAGTWTLQQTITLANPGFFDSFGASVDLEGDRLVVGAPMHGATRLGGAWVYDRSGTQWSQTAYLVAGDLVWGDAFGYDVAVSGDTVIVGARGQGGGAVDTGAAYVYRSTGGTWNHEQKLQPSAGTMSGYFGTSVDIESDLVLVGATNTNNPGAAYAFTRVGSTWALEALLTAWSGNGFETFGDSVALDGERALIGAWQDSAVAFGEGSAYVFDRDGGAWTGVTRLIRSTAVISRFGRGTALSGDTAFVGATIAAPSGVIYQYGVDASVGSNYCTAELNSTGQAGLMHARGSDQVLDNNIHLNASQLPFNSFGYFLVGQGSNGIFPVANSQGRICIGGAPIGRYINHILNTGASGWFAVVVDITQTPTPTGLFPIQAGETWNYQAWFRDAVGGVATSNFTDALSVTFL